MRLGLLARADNGGLATMTWEFHRHMAPDRTLIIDLGERGRGRTRVDRYPGAAVNHGMDSDLPEATVRDFVDGLDVLYSAETLYRSDVASIARAAGCATIVHSMPELWRQDLDPPDGVWAPTDWELGRLPAGTPVVPVPIAGDRLPFRQRTEAKTFLHVSAPAMLDRNGTRLVVDALPYIQAECTVVVAGSGRVGPRRVGRVHVEWANDQVENYWDRYNQADVLLLPRRYAGLSLPMQEATGSGMPVVSLDLEPQRQWISPRLLAPAWQKRQARMVGGDFWVHDAAPADLAAIITRLATNPTEVAAESTKAGERAAELSWDVWAPRYRSRLEEAASAAR